MARIIVTLLIFLIFCTISSIADTGNHYAIGSWVEAPHSKLRLLPKEIKLLDNRAKVILEAQFNIDKDWYIYSSKKTDIGLPTDIKIVSPINAKMTEINWPNPLLKTHKEGLSSVIYQNKVTIPINIEIPEQNIKDLHLCINYLVCGSSCIPVELDFSIDNKEDFVINQQFSESSPQNSANLFFMILIALLGGLILNVMPCVLPVLSLKLLALVNNQGEVNNFYRRINFLASASGIIVAFMGLSTLTIIMRTLGKTVGWGIQFTNPIFIIFLIIVLMIFACNLLGSFNINLPSSILKLFSKSDANVNSGNLVKQVIGNFTGGVLATILATPCSAPFVGTAVSFALSQGIKENLIIFFSLGCGMALPYLLLTIFPKLANYLPKPGAWMLKVKYAMGILLLLTVLWLLYVLCSQLGVKAAFLLFLLCLLLKFVLETNTGLLKNKAAKWIGVLIVISCMFYIPPKTADYQNLHKSHIDVIWQDFNPELIPSLIAAGKVVVVDITADWCIVCKVNKYMVLNREKTLEIFRDNNIVAMRVELTEQNRHTIMKYMKDHQRFGIPFDIVYGPNAPDGILLKELLTFEELMEAIKQAGKKI